MDLQWFSNLQKIISYFSNNKNKNMQHHSFLKNFTLMEDLLGKDSEDLRSCCSLGVLLLVSAISFSLMQWKFYIHSENHFLKSIIKHERESQGVIFPSIICLKIPEIILARKLTLEEELVIFHCLIRHR